MAALSSSLDSGVNSVVPYHRGQSIEVRVRLEVKVRVLKDKIPMLGSRNIDYWS